MERDSFKIARTCKQCQIHGNLIHAPAQELHVLATSWTFCQWGLDLVGKINPSSYNGHKFILVATKYFTKWIEVVPLINITGKQIAAFILNYIISLLNTNDDYH